MSCISRKIPQRSLIQCRTIQWPTVAPSQRFSYKERQSHRSSQRSAPLHVGSKFQQKNMIIDQAWGSKKFWEAEENAWMEMIIRTQNSSPSRRQPHRNHQKWKHQYQSIIHQGVRMFNSFHLFKKCVHCPRKGAILILQQVFHRIFNCTWEICKRWVIEILYNKLYRIILKPPF